MGRFSKVSETAFNDFQVDAGVLLKNFDPETPELVDADIICATTGGISPSCTPTYSDYAADVDNAKNNMLEFMRLDGWTCTMGFTALDTSPEVLKMALGAADATDGKVTPRNSLKNADFADIWWVGDKADGGFVAICLKNALSTGGLSLSTSKNGKGNISVTLTGHYSVATQDSVPMEFYVGEGTDAA